jgi:hypothetical protein
MKNRNTLIRLIGDSRGISDLVRTVGLLMTAERSKTVSSMGIDLKQTRPPPHTYIIFAKLEYIIEKCEYIKKCIH